MKEVNEEWLFWLLSVILLLAFIGLSSIIMSIINLFIWGSNMKNTKLPTETQEILLKLRAIIYDTINTHERHTRTIKISEIITDEQEPRSLISTAQEYVNNTNNELRSNINGILDTYELLIYNLTSRGYLNKNFLEETYEYRIR